MGQRDQGSVQPANDAVDRVVARRRPTMLVRHGNDLSMHCGTTESGPPQSQTLDQLLEGSRQRGMATIRIGLPRQTSQALVSIGAHPALQPAQLQAALTCN